MRSLSLHHLGFRELSPFELVETAASVGCAHVCIFTYCPEGIVLPSVGDADVEPLRRLMRDAGVSVLGTSSYPITATADISAYEAGFERAAKLGGRHATCRIVDEDEARATDKFARFAELGARHGLNPAIEPMGYGNGEAFPQAVRIIAAAGRGILTLDPLHIIRTGTSWDWIEALDPALVDYVQLCDGPLVADEHVYWHEGLEDRLPLGDGEYPLHRLLGITPADLPISLEIPCERLRKQGLSGRALAAEVVGRSRAWLERQDSASS